jgi:hypothetical protein
MNCLNDLNFSALHTATTVLFLAAKKVKREDAPHQAFVARNQIM